jgi:hypothetical protein
MMRVLIACERSGVVREAFRALGVEAWSCDLAPAEDGSKFHIQHDALEVAYYNSYSPDYWTLMLAHPECTWLSVSGIHWNYRGRQGKTPEQCWQETDKAADFFMKLANAPIKHRAIENPKSIMSTRWRKCDQKLQPYEFGHDASKETWIWLENLPPIQIDPTQRVGGRLVEWNGKVVERWSNQTDSGQNRLGPGEARSMDRARTYEGIANAMARTWTRFLRND